MQRLEEDTSSNGLFVSTFIVRAEQIGPSTVWSDDCGLGWLFGIKQDSVKSGLEQTAGVFVFSKLCGSFLQGLQYRVTLTLCTHKEDEGSGLGISVVEKEEKGGWPSEVSASDQGKCRTVSITDNAIAYCSLIQPAWLFQQRSVPCQHLGSVLRLSKWTFFAKILCLLARFLSSKPALLPP